MATTTAAQNLAFTAQLKQFIVDNNIVGTTAGVCIALASKDTLLSLVADVIIPGITKLILMLHLKIVNDVIPKGNADFNFTNFIKQFITWILMIIISFFFITYTLKWFIGNTVKTEVTKAGANAGAKATNGTNADIDNVNTVLNNVTETFYGSQY
jgi:large-conductance mechanosensitive channel